MKEGEDGKVSPSNENPLLAALERLNHPAKLAQESLFNIPLRISISSIGNS